MVGRTKSQEMPKQNLTATQGNMGKKYRGLAEICWPEICAVCGGHADKELALDSSAVQGVTNIGIGVIVTSKVTRVRHPVCSRHYFKAWVASGLSQRSLVGLGMGVLAALPILSLLIAGIQFVAYDTPIQFNSTMAIGLAVSNIYFYFFFWARRNTSVRISATTPASIELAFNSEAYAKAFAEKNDVVVGSNCTVIITFTSAREEMNRIAEEGDLAFHANLPKSANPYRSHHGSANDLTAAGYWDRGYDVAAKRGRTEKVGD